MVTGGDSAEPGSVSGDRQAELVDLMRRVAAGDRDGFRLLYQRTGAKLYASVRRILRSESAAEDAVQEAFVRVWRRAGDFDAAIASPIAWMTTIARHAAIDMARRGAERVSAASADDPEILERLADESQAGERLMAGRALATCLEGIEPDKRGMILLAYCHGWSREELADRYNRPVATVKTILRRSLIALKECLGGRD
jgi:RNA polymerase sigma-70 factor, ECF subfamily